MRFHSRLQVESLFRGDFDNRYGSYRGEQYHREIDAAIDSPDITFVARDYDDELCYCGEYADENRAKILLRNKIAYVNGLLE